MKTTSRLAAAATLCAAAFTATLLVTQSIGAESAKADSSQASAPPAEKAPSFSGSGSLTGARSRKSIMDVVIKNLRSLRDMYNQALRQPETATLTGTIAVKFAIDEHGKVISSSVVESSTGNASFDKSIAAAILGWSFEPVDKPGDVTEVVYPFVFSQ